MKRPDPEDAFKRATKLLKAAQEIRDTARKEHAAADAINPATRAYRLSDTERGAAHNSIRRDALKALDALGLRDLGAQAATLAAEAEQYLSVDAVLGRARFTPEPPSEADRMQTEILEELRRAAAFRDVAMLDDAERASRVAQAAEENDLATLGVIKRVTDQESRRHGAEAITKTHSGLITAFQKVEPPKFDRWLDETVGQLQSTVRQAGQIRDSLVIGVPPARTVAEKVAVINAATAAATDVTIPITHNPTPPDAA